MFDTRFITNFSLEKNPLTNSGFDAELVWDNEEEC